MFEILFFLTKLLVGHNFSHFQNIKSDFVLSDKVIPY